MSQVNVTSKDELENLIQIAIRKAFGEFRNQNPEENQDKIFSIKEASSFLNLAQQTLYGFTSKRAIPFLKRGKKLYFKKIELENWLLEGKRKSKDEIMNELKNK